MRTFELTTHQSFGSDGYTSGTWEWRITSSDGEMWFDGGWPSREVAQDKGDVRLSKLMREECDCRCSGRDARGRFTR